MTAPTSEIYRAILASLDGELTLPSDDLAAARAKMEASHGHPIAADTQVEWLQLGGTRCALVTANAVTRRDRYLVYFHGGAFIAAAGDGFLFYAEMLSQHLGSRVLMVDYSLAPEQTFPTQLHEGCNAYLGLLDRGIAPANIGFIGDSCGGGLVLTTLMQLRDDDAALPSCAISLSGWLDLAANNDQRDPFYWQAYTHKRGRDYAGDAELSQALVSPVFGEYHDLPPLLLLAGEIDPTAGHAERAYQRALVAGIDAQLDIAPGMVHGYPGLASAGVPEAVAALDRVAQFLAHYCPAALVER